MELEVLKIILYEDIPIPEMELEGLEEEREEVRMPRVRNEMMVESI